MPRSQEGLARLVARDGASAPVIAAFRSVDRAGFVPEAGRANAYADRPIALPERQTTSQPSLIARMIDSAGVRPGDRVLEIGAGYGFQTALLATLAAKIVSMERFESLAAGARANLERAGITGAEVVVGDGWAGRPEQGPFDAVIVSAQASRVPEALVDQLAEGGRLVIPLARSGAAAVFVFRKTGGVLEELRMLTPACFVPLVEP